MTQESKLGARPQVIVRHHRPEQPDLEALQVIRELWASALLRQYRRSRVVNEGFAEPHQMNT